MRLMLNIQFVNTFIINIRYSDTFYNVMSPQLHSSQQVLS